MWTKDLQGERVKPFAFLPRETENCENSFHKDGETPGTAQMDPAGDSLGCPESPKQMCDMIEKEYSPNRSIFRGKEKEEK